MEIILLCIVITSFILCHIKNTEITIFRSYIQSKDHFLDDILGVIILSIFFPYTWYKLIKIKNIKIKKINPMNINLKRIIPIGIILVALYYLTSFFINISNSDKVLRNVFKQKTDQRTAFYDKMYKVISQHSEIVVRNDSSFQRIVNMQVTGQKNGENVMWSWVQQSNPTATFNTVVSLYQELGSTIASERKEFYNRELEIQAVVLEHSNLVDLLPGSVAMSILGRTKLDYTPIIANLTDSVIVSGRDNNVKLFK